MTTLICDICGTSYLDTEAKCPTCGYSRAFTEEAPGLEQERQVRPKVRGGFFSHKNVQKRQEERAKNQGEGAEESPILMEIPVLSQAALPENQGAKQAVVDEIRVPEFTKSSGKQEPAQSIQQVQNQNQKGSRWLTVILVLSTLVFLLSLGYIVVQYVIPYIQQMTDLAQTVPVNQILAETVSMFWAWG